MSVPRDSTATPFAAGGIGNATAGEEGVIRLELPASHRYLTLVSACVAELLARAEGLAEPEVITYNVQLAVQEVCVNIVTHAYRGRQDGRLFIAMQVDAASRRLIIGLRDTGVAFDPDGVPLPNLEEGQEHGYGLFLIKELMDDVSYERVGDENRWRMVKSW